MPAGRPLTIPRCRRRSDVRAEWKQIYHETWRLQRDLFYAANHNGLDLAKAEAMYAPFVAGLGSRSDLTYLMREMLSNLSVSHLAVNDPPADDAAGGGRGRGGGRGGACGAERPRRLLGVDVTVDRDRYRIARSIAATSGSPGQWARWRSPAWTYTKATTFARSTDTT